MPLDYPHPTELEQRVGLHYKPFRLFRLTPSLAIQPLVRAIFFYLASNPRSRVSLLRRSVQSQAKNLVFPLDGYLSFSVVNATFLELRQSL